MANFKDYVKKDLDGLIFNGEFAEPHNIDGKVVMVILDSARLKDKINKDFEGTFVGEMLFYVRKSDIKSPKKEAVMTFDGRVHTIVDALESGFEMYEITLCQNRS